MLMVLLQQVSHKADGIAAGGSHNADGVIATG